MCWTSLCAELRRPNATICRYCGTRQDDENFQANALPNDYISTPNPIPGDAICGRCGAKEQPAAGNCNKCGIELPYQELTANPAFSAEKDEALNNYMRRPKPVTNSSNVSSPKSKTSASNPFRKPWFYIFMILVILAAFKGQTIFQYIQGTISGELTFDSSAVVDSIQESLGKDVKVECPSLIQGHPGDVRQCILTTEFGTGIADVTIQSSAGDFTWEVRD